MYELLNNLFNGPSCDEQEEMLQLQAAYTEGKRNRMEQRKVIVKWMLGKGCDIGNYGPHHYMLNGELFEWSNVGPINDWSE